MVGVYRFVVAAKKKNNERKCRRNSQSEKETIKQLFDFDFLLLRSLFLQQLKV